VECFVLPEASCLDCAKATSAVEGRIAVELFRAIRRQMKFPMKPRSRSRGFEVGLDGVGASVLAEGYPGLLISFAFPLPGILAGAAPCEEFGGGIALSMLPQFGERLNALGDRLEDAGRSSRRPRGRPPIVSAAS
jgi:hypothetical protein